MSFLWNGLSWVFGVWRDQLQDTAFWAALTNQYYGRASARDNRLLVEKGRSVSVNENIVFPSGEFPKDRFLILKPSNHTRLGQNHSKSHTKIEFDQRHDKILKILFF